MEWMLINNNIKKEIVKVVHISGYEIIASLHNKDIAGPKQQG